MLRNANISSLQEMNKGVMVENKHKLNDCNNAILTVTNRSAMRPESLLKYRKTFLLNSNVLNGVLYIYLLYSKCCTTKRMHRVATAKSWCIRVLSESLRSTFTEYMLRNVKVFSETKLKYRKGCTLLGDFQNKQNGC